MSWYCCLILASLSVEVPHKGAETNDVAWLTLDRFYCRTGDTLTYAAKDFDRARIGLRNLATGSLLLEAERAGSGMFALTDVPAGEYAFEVDDGARRTSCQVEVLAEGDCRGKPVTGSLRLENGGLVADFVKAKAEPVFAWNGSEHAFGDVRFGNTFDMTYARDEKGGYYRFNATRPMFGAAARLAGDPFPLTIRRLAYECQIPTRIATNKTDVAAPVDDNAAFYLAQYQALKRAFPTRILSVHCDDAESAATYAPACDLFEFSTPYVKHPLLRVRAAFDWGLKTANGKPVIAWVPGSLPNKGRSRTADELNTTVRYAILRGASGCVFHLGHGGISRENTRIWSYLEKGARATARWYPDWVRAKPIAVRGTTDADVAYAVRRTPNGLMVLAANLSPFSRTFSFADPLTNERRVYALTGFGSLVASIETADLRKE